jgi:hypothetical protein
MEAYSGAVEARPEPWIFIKDHGGSFLALEAHPGTCMEVILDLEAHPGAMEAHPGAMEAQPRAMERLTLEPWLNLEP